MRKTLFSRFIASSVAAFIFLLSPGTSVYEAAAQTIQRVPVQASGAPVSYGVLKGLPGGMPSLPGALPSGVSFAAPAGVLGSLPVPGKVSVETGLTGVEAAPSLPAGLIGTPGAVSPAEVAATSLTELKTPAPRPVLARATLDQAAESVPVLLSPDTPEAGARAAASRTFDALKAAPEDDGAAAVEAGRPSGQGVLPAPSGLEKPTSASSRTGRFSLSVPAALIKSALTRKSVLVWAAQAAGMSALAALTGTWIVPAVAGLVVSIVTTSVSHYRRASRGFKDSDRAPPEDSPLKPGAWAPRVIALAALFTLLDWGVKYMFLTMGLPIVYHDMVPARVLLMKLTIPLNIAGAVYFLSLAHSSKPLLEKLDAWTRRHPILGNAAKALLWVLAFPMGINDKRYGGDLARKDPVVGRMLGIVGIIGAVVVAAGFGNGIEGIVNGRVIDFIPVGKGRANIADFFLFLGMPLLWMGLDFLKAARVANETRKPMSYKAWKYFVPPVLGMLVFAYSTMAGYDAIPLPAWYVMLFSVLFSVGILAGSALIQRFVDAFNARYAPAPQPAPDAK